MALYIPHSIFHLARLLYVRPETFGPDYVHSELRNNACQAWRDRATLPAHLLARFERKSQQRLGGSLVFFRIKRILVPSQQALLRLCDPGSIFFFNLTDTHVCRIKYALHASSMKGKNSGSVIQCQDTADRTGPCSLILKEGATKSVRACNTLFTVRSWRLEHTFRAPELHPKVGNFVMRKKYK